MTQIWVNDKIELQYRQPYLRFFLWAYMNADAESDQYNINDIQYQKETWTCLTMLAAHLRATADKARTQRVCGWVGVCVRMWVGA
jgi:hypothetical protein